MIRDHSQERTEDPLAIDGQGPLFKPFMLCSFVLCSFAGIHYGIMVIPAPTHLRSAQHRCSQLKHDQTWLYTCYQS